MAEMLRDDRETQFDFLVCMTGADWGETLGVVYHLRSTTLGHEVVLRIETADREHPGFAQCMRLVAFGQPERA